MLFGKREENPLMRKPLKKVNDLLMADEEVLYVRDKPIKPGNFRLVLTNKRMIQVDNSTWFIDSTYWYNFERVWIEKDVVKFNYLGTAVLPMEGLPKEDMEIIYKIARERLDAISEKRKPKTPVNAGIKMSN